MPRFANRIVVIGFGSVARCRLLASSIYSNGLPPAKIIHVNQ